MSDLDGDDFYGDEFEEAPKKDTFDWGPPPGQIHHVSGIKSPQARIQYEETDSHMMEDRGR